MKNIHKVNICWVLSFLLLLSAGCTYIIPGDREELMAINTIGVLPAHAENLPKSGAGTPAELQDGVETINSLLADYFSKSRKISMISQNALEGLSSTESGKPFYLAREAGQQLNYDAILITSVERFQKREGSEYAVIKPASVAFSFKLLDVDKGQIIWSADFDQTQQPLFENILKTRSTGSGFRWLTAAELAAAGLNKKLNSSPYLQRD